MEPSTQFGDHEIAHALDDQASQLNAKYQKMDREHDLSPKKSKKTVDALNKMAGEHSDLVGKIKDAAGRWNSKNPKKDLFVGFTSDRKPVKCWDCDRRFSFPSHWLPGKD